MTDKAISESAAERPRRPLRTATLAVMAVTALVSALLAWSLASDARYAFAKPAPIFIGDLATLDPAPHGGGFVRAGADLEAPAVTFRRPFEPTEYRLAKVKGTTDRWVLYTMPDGYPEARFLPPRLTAGRLARASDLGARYRGVGGVAGDGWVLVDGEDPHGLTWVLGLEVMLLGFLAFNLVSIARILRKVA